MVSTRKIMNTKIGPLIKIDILYIGHFYIWQSVKKVLF